MEYVSDRRIIIALSGTVLPVACLLLNLFAFGTLLDILAGRYFWGTETQEWFLVVVAVLLLPLWYRTFFDNMAVGLDFPHYVRWSSKEEFTLRGLFFSFTVPTEKILCYRVLGIEDFESTFEIMLKVENPRGRVQRAWLTPSMPNKQELLVLLRERGIQRRYWRDLFLFGG